MGAAGGVLTGQYLRQKSETTAAPTPRDGIEEARVRLADSGSGRVKSLPARV